jgi:hypothetical protein
MLLWPSRGHSCNDDTRAPVFDHASRRNAPTQPSDAARRPDAAPGNTANDLNHCQAAVSAAAALFCFWFNEWRPKAAEPRTQARPRLVIPARGTLARRPGADGTRARGEDWHAGQGQTARRPRPSHAPPGTRARGEHWHAGQGQTARGPETQIHWHAGQGQTARRPRPSHAPPGTRPSAWSRRSTWRMRRPKSKKVPGACGARIRVKARSIQNTIRASGAGAPRQIRVYSQHLH